MSFEIVKLKKKEKQLLVLRVSIGFVLYFSAISHFPQRVLKLKLSWNSRSDSGGVVLPLGVEVSSRDFCCHCVQPEGFFHTAVTDQVDV